MEQIREQEREINNSVANNSEDVKVPTDKAKMDLTGTGITTEKIEDVKEVKNNACTYETHSAHTGNNKRSKELSQPSDNKVTMTPSPMLEYYEELGFGVSDTVVKRLENKTYNINLRPLAIDQSPLKELSPEFSDVQPLTNFRRALSYENAYIYSFNLPDGIKDVHKNTSEDMPYNLTSAWSIPALTVLRDNLIGLPHQGLEWPVISSAYPPSCNSYLHTVQHRVTKSGVLDLRFKITANKKNRLKEIYILGRYWVPLNNIHISWQISAGNYDAAQPTLFPAFSEIGKITLDTRKELTNLVQTLRFVDKTFPPDIEQSMLNVLESLGHNKLSLSRLYWRIWCCIAEASLCESQKRRWHVSKIYNEHSPMILNGPMALKELFAEAQMAVQPFFITHAMLDAIGRTHTTEVLQFLLCESFDAECYFGVSRNWPSLGDVRIVLPSDHRSLYSLPSTLSIHSETLYAILSYFARVLDQQQLIDEIGKTVASFLLRPEGDAAWLGHSFISLSLPLFRCKRSLHFAWSCVDNNLHYSFKTPPYYKLAWMGCIKYMQISLCANTVLSELGIFSMLQLESNGFRINEEWIKAIKRLFWRDQGSCEFNRKIQHVGFRYDWGSLQNRILSSIVILKPQICNFTRVVQWQEWLLFQLLQPESTWMAGQMAHIKPKTQLQPVRSYSPVLCGIETGLGDIYYRLATEDNAHIMLHVKSYSNGYTQTVKAHALCSPTGYPLDGQFRHLTAGDDMHTYYHFVPKDEISCWRIMHKWHERSEYHWRLSCPQQFSHSGDSAEDSSIYLRSSAYASPNTQDCGLLEIRRNREKLLQLPDPYDAINYKVVVYGSPTGEADHDILEREDGGSDSFVDRIATQNPIEADAIQDQQYPIHYCDGIVRPTVGDIMARCGISVNKTTAGVSALSSYEIINMANKMEKPCSVPLYKPHSSTVQSQQNGIGAAADARAALPATITNVPRNSTANVKIDRSTIEEQIRKKQEHRAQQREKFQQQIREKEKERELRFQQSAHINTRVPITKWKNELRSFAKAWNADLALLEVDPQWQSWDGMEDLTLSSTGSSEALVCRYSNILRGYDNRDLIGMLRLSPRIARGELCRVLIHMMEDSTPYLSANSRDARIHDKVKNFLAVAMDNLQHCNILTEEELHAHFGCNHLKFSDWHCYGTLSFDNFINIPLKWTEDTSNCPLAHEHPNNVGPGPEGEGRYTGTSLPLRTTTTHDTGKEPAELISAIEQLASEKTKNNSVEEVTNFPVATPQCSAQSPKSLVSSPKASSTVHKQRTLSLERVLENACVMQPTGKMVKSKTGIMVPSLSTSDLTSTAGVTCVGTAGSPAVFLKEGNESIVTDAQDSSVGKPPITD